MDLSGRGDTRFMMGSWPQEGYGVITDITVQDAGDKGQGVFALRDFEQGEFLFRRRHSRVVVNSEIPTLSEDERRHLCELDWETSAVLLPPGCYLNHSCEPNAMRSGVKVVAWRDIHRGEEITIDYRLNAFGEDRWECRCGSAGCDGYVVGSFFALDDERQRLYLPYAPTFIRQEYLRRSRERARCTNERV
jgi:histone-lysine N-methyltransferase SETD2